MQASAAAGTQRSHTAKLMHHMLSPALSKCSYSSAGDVLQFQALYQIASCSSASPMLNYSLVSLQSPPAAPRLAGLVAELNIHLRFHYLLSSVNVLLPQSPAYFIYVFVYIKKYMYAYICIKHICVYI